MVNKLKLQITNKLEVQNYPSNLLQVITDELKIANPKHAEAINNGRSTYRIPPFLYHFDVLPNEIVRAPRGYRRRLLHLAKELGISVAVDDRRNHFEPRYDIDSSKIKYRNYQKRAVLELIKETEGILRAPAGSGKTVMGLSLVPLLGQPTLWLTHTDRLAKQTLQRAEQFLPSLGKDDVGMLGGRKWKVGEMLTVAMVQTLIRRPMEAVKLANNFGLVVLDEAHHCPAKTFLNVVSCFNPYYLYGLTATPYRRDGLESMMFQAMGPETVRITMSEVENEGGIIIPTVKYRMMETRRDEGNNMAKLLKGLVEDDRRTQLIVGDVVREALQGNDCIVISDRKAHCEKMFELLSLSLKKVGIATGDYSKKKVDATVKQFEDSEINVLVTTFSLLGEGFDVSKLNRAFITMPFRARAKAEQLLGRIQRPAEGKTDAIVYDYVDMNIPVLYYQFYSKSRSDCRYATYQSLGARVEPYE